MLTAYYDLATSPPTYNFFDFLLTAEGKRLELGEQRMRVRILPGPVEGFRRDRLPPYGGDERSRWLENICMRMPELLPSCGEPAQMDDGTVFNDGPSIGRGEYLVGFHTNVNAARRGLAPFTGDTKITNRYRARHGAYVTISMRETAWYASRQSKLENWLPAADAIKAMGYEVVFVRDAAKAEEVVPGHRIEPGASKRIVERASLYAGAKMNLGISNGPMWFAWFMGVPVAIFNLVHTDEPYTSAETFKACGLPLGEQLPNARTRQRLVWEKDTAGAIVNTFRDLMGVRPQAQLERA